MHEKNLTFIDHMFKEHTDLVDLLTERGEISYAQTVRSYLAKTLVIACGSYFESRITDAIEHYAKRVSNEDEALYSLVRNKAIKRQYHSYFEWESRNVNRFLGMFGATFKDVASREIKAGQLAGCAADFMELGELRNQIAHGNYVTFGLDKSADEIYALYGSGLQFVVYVEGKLNPPS
jgi:hypothetical protein